MRLNDRIVVAAVGSLGLIATGFVARAGGAVLLQGDPVPFVTMKKFTNGHDADLAPGPSIAVGDLITWTYVVTNTWTGTLTGIVVSDDMGVLVDCDNDSRTLAAGAILTCTGTGVATAGPYVNVGWVTALAGPRAAIASDASHYVGVESGSGGPGGAGSDVKVPLCHRNRPDDYNLIRVNVAALPAHMAHGDSNVADSVPNQPGFVFGPECVAIPAVLP